MIEKSKVLVVDDSNTNLTLMCRFLQSVDANILTATNGNDALDLVDQHYFSVIILDIQMPGMNGIELAELMRKKENSRLAPLLFVSAVYSSEQSMAKGIHTGAVDFLAKPVEWPLLINKVQVFVDMDQQSKQLQFEIDQRNIAQQQLYDEKELLQITLESIGDAVITTDIGGFITYLNPVAETMTGWSDVEAKNYPVDKVFKIVHEGSETVIESPVERCLREGNIIKLNDGIDLISRADKKYSIQDSVAPIFNRQGELTGAVLIFSDVTKSRQLTRELAYQASHDPLTDLMNRREFEFRLNRVVESVKLQGGEHALCYLDLDQFKVINDACGHTAGDILLKQISQLLSFNIRTRDSIGRLGGDEFAIIMEHCSVDQSVKTAEKLRKAVSDYRFRFKEKIYKIAISIGIMSITDEVSNVQDLLINADTACFAAKRGGRNQVRVYDNQDSSLIQQHDEIKWVSRIHHALETNAFELYYQVIRSCDDSAPLSIEILIRLRDENNEIIAPGLFLPAAERYDLITLIDHWVIENVFKWIYENPEYLQKLKKVSINLSGMTLCNRDLLILIINLLERYQLPTEKICFEITETAMIENLTKANYFIDALRSKGCKFALDDFGIGLSSFSYLKNLPVEYLKIDGSFVKNMLNDPVDQELVSSINDIGHVLGKQTIAEFVENQELWDSLIELGVDFVQGYAIGKPKSIDDIIDDLEQKPVLQ